MCSAYNITHLDDLKEQGCRVCWQVQVFEVISCCQRKLTACSGMHSIPLSNAHIVSNEYDPPLNNSFTRGDLNTITLSMLTVNRYYFQLLAPDYSVVYGFYSIIKHFGWRRIGIITQDATIVVSIMITQAFYCYR